MKMRFPLLLALAALPLFAADNPAPFDWQKARELFQRSQSGAQLTPDEQKIVEEAKRRHAAGENPNGQPGQPQGSKKNQQPPPTPPENLVPLTELTGKYQDQDGGLYGGGKNEPSTELATRAKQALAQVRPLNAEGKPATDGKIVMVSLGMSNTTMEFSAFKRLADADSRKASNLVIVDCAQGGKTAAAWATNDQPWEVAMTRLKDSGVSPAQVQVMWLKQANARPSTGYPAATNQLRDDIRTDIKRAREKYPNLRMIFLSSRIYAGYAMSPLNPEPYAYEGAFAVRAVIKEQPADGPVLLWGPYLWTNGEKGRALDDLKWLREDCGPDGTHPSQKGQEKVAHQLLDFFTKNPYAKPWFAKSS
jgi:lysophospholipase L1-like esterase